MSFISWVEENRGNHGLLIQIIKDAKLAHLELFFPTRLRMYLDLLEYFALPVAWLASLPKLEEDMEVTIPTREEPNNYCPICTNPYNCIKIPEREQHQFGTTHTTKKQEETTEEIPVRLPCDHIMGLKCVFRLARGANASTGVVCPFCRASHNHVPVSSANADADAEEEEEDDDNDEEGTTEEYKLGKCMWIMLETFVRLRGAGGHCGGEEEFEDMETVLEWVKNDEILSENVPDEEKREAIKYAAKCWVKIGDEELLRLLAARVYGHSVRCTTP